MASKKCTRCGETKPLSDFSRHKAMADGHINQCRVCMNAAAQARRRRNGRNETPEARRRWTLKKLYGMTQADYDALLVSQDGKCAICQTDSPGGPGNKFHVDHDHATGRVRGLLCHHCNTGLGNLYDDPVRLRAALRYLEVSGF